MPRDLPIGNGNVLIAFDQNALLREFHFPHIGQENHTKGEPFRFGAWVNGQFSWVPDGWQIKRDYLEDSLVTDIEFIHDQLGLRIISNDLVDFEENIYLKKLTVENLSDEPKDVRLFLAHDFHIYGTDIGDTAAFRPENQSLIHYKDERYFLINIFANHKFGIDLFATGNKEINFHEGTWKDAEDGILSGNPIAQGSVDSVAGIPFSLSSHGKETCFYWIAIGKNWEDVRTINQSIKKITPQRIFKRTHDYWKLWVNKENLNFEMIPEKIGRVYRKSLLICRTQINNCGSIISGTDSDAIYFNRDTYSYMWPRDASLIAYGLDLAGYDTTSFFRFCGKIIEKDGFFLHKYNPTGTVASSWHPWLDHQKPQIPLQEDETALVVWALWNHYKIFKDLEFIRPLYESLIKKAADFMVNYRNLKTGLPLPSYDLWEERQGILTYTVSTVFGGLMAAANFATAFGETDLAEDYRNVATRIREAMDQYLYLKDEKRFARMINFNKDGSMDVDATIDASLFAIFAFGPYAPDDEKVKNTMDQIHDKLWIPTNVGGLSRYENDSYYRQGEQAPSNPWFVTTLWMAQYHIARAKTQKDLKPALEILEWVADHALPSGVIAEQINPQTHEPLSVSPLTWSHGTYIATVQEYIHKLVSLYTQRT